MKKLHDELKIRLGAAKQQEHLYRADGPKIKFKKIAHVSKDIAWADNLKKSYGIIGPNGCGKSTLINMLRGNNKDYEGFLRLGEWVKYSYMGQEVLFENDGTSMFQLIIFKSKLQEKEARDYLARFQFYGDEINKAIRVLSGGERVRLYLACVMLEDANCLILDEPTNHLDMPARDAVEEAFLEIENGKITTYEGNYDFYRQVKYGAEEERVEEKESRPDKGSGKNFSNKRKNIANRENPEIYRQEVEAQIIIIEDRIKEMEGQFDESTPREKYQEYGELLKDAERLYWNDLIT